MFNPTSPHTPPDVSTGLTLGMIFFFVALGNVGNMLSSNGFVATRFTIVTVGFFFNAEAVLVPVDNDDAIELIVPEVVVVVVVVVVIPPTAFGEFHGFFVFDLPLLLDIGL